MSKNRFEYHRDTGTDIGGILEDLQNLNPMDHIFKTLQYIEWLEGKLEASLNDYSLPEWFIQELEGLKT